MDEEKRPAAEEGEQKPERELSGQYLWRVLKPAGCVAVLLLLAAFLVICFTHRSARPEDYQPAQETVYYADHPEAAAQEISEHLLSVMPGCSVAVEGDRVLVTAPAKTMDAVRALLTEKFGETPFVFAEKEER